ncbi:MAG: Lrp/AsnC ligand binding domain-containing protein [Methanomassiliicoccales archaeon]
MDGDRMVMAFILVATTSCSSYEIRDQLLELDEVIEAHVVFGQYDIIVKAEVEDSETLGKLVFGGIRSNECVISTATLTVLP